MHSGCVPSNFSSVIVEHGLHRYFLALRASIFSRGLSKSSTCRSYPCTRVTHYKTMQRKLCVKTRVVQFLENHESRSYLSSLITFVTIVVPMLMIPTCIEDLGVFEKMTPKGQFLSDKVWKCGLSSLIVLATSVRFLKNLKP